MTRNRIIQHLINRYQLKSYLEIGVEYRQTFDSILCKRKVGIEPYLNVGVVKKTSDEFFSQNEEFFDIIFIDGLHEEEQAKRDIENALKFLNHHGYIVMHDCNPTDEVMQRVPREQLVWTGDVWKAYTHYRRYPYYDMYVVDTDYGCGVITRGYQEHLIVDNPTFDGLSQNRKEWLNLISVDDFKKKMI